MKWFRAECVTISSTVQQCDSLRILGWFGHLGSCLFVTSCGNFSFYQMKPAAKKRSSPVQISRWFTLTHHVQGWAVWRYVLSVSLCVADLWPGPCPPVRLSLDSESDSSDGSHSPSRDPAPPPQKHNSSNNKVSPADLISLPAFIDVLLGAEMVWLANED